MITNKINILNSRAEQQQFLRKHKSSTSSSSRGHLRFAQSPADLVGDQVHVVVSLDVLDLIAVVVQHWSGLLVELVQTGLQLLSGIVTTLHQRLASNVILALILGRVEVDIVGASGGSVDQATSDTLDQEIIVDAQVDHLVNGNTLLGQHGVQKLGLCHSSGETIQDETLLALRVPDGLSDDASDDIITNQLASIHDGLGLLAHLRAILHSLSQHITSGQVAQAVLILDSRSLSSLTSTRRAKEDCSPTQNCNRCKNTPYSTLLTSRSAPHCSAHVSPTHG